MVLPPCLFTAGKSVCKHEPFTCDEVCQENSGNEGSLTGNTAFVAPMRGQKLGRLHMDKLVDKSKGVVRCIGAVGQCCHCVPILQLLTLFY